MPGRSYSNRAYRFGYCGYDNDGENENLINRIYTSKIGRFLSQDLFRWLYPSHSPYSISLNSVLYLMDINGLLPGDLFFSVEEAAIDFAQTYNDKSISQNKEFGSSFYRIKYNGVYYYTYSVPKVGTSGEVNPSNPIFHWGKIVGKIHTHSEFTCGSNDLFSAHDYEYADFYMTNPHFVPFWLVTPTGFLSIYGPKGSQFDPNPRIYDETIPYDPKSNIVTNNPAYNSKDLIKNERTRKGIRDWLLGPKFSHEKARETLSKFKKNNKVANARTLNNK